MDFLPGNNCDEWQYLGNSENAIPYQQVTVFNHMQWGDFPIENFVGACGKFSGPLALIWNADEPMLLNGDITLSTDIFIYDSTGKKLSQIPGREWSHSKVITLGWTLSERLCVLFEDGRFFLFSLLGNQIAEIKLFDQAFTDLVSMGITTENGCIVYTRTGKLLFISCEDDNPSVIEYPSLSIGSGNSVTALGCIEGRFTESGEMSIIVACWNEAMYVVNSQEVIDLSIKQCFCGRIVKMAVAPNAHYIACFTHEGFITVISSSFDSKVFEFNTHTHNVPTSLLWCGEDSIVSYWKGYNMLMLSPFCEYLRFEYETSEEPLFLVQEIDSLRVLSRSRHEIIRSVPPSIYNVYMEGSESSGSLLRKNFSRYTQKKGDMDMKIGVGDMTTEQVLEGIQECLKAAEDELSTFLQEELLRSVSYGQAYLAEEDQEGIANDLPGVARTLRILNALRCPEVGLYLTYEEYLFLKDRAVISRLLSRRLYYLGVKICQFLCIPHDFVLIEWACEKVKSSADLPTSELCMLIHEKLSGYDVSYNQIVWTAYQAERIDLACLLLQYEKKVADRVPMLLMIKEYEKAAAEACFSHDSDLIQFTAIQLFLKYMNGELEKSLFVSIMKSYPSLYQCVSRHISINQENEKETFLKDCEQIEEYVNWVITKAFKTSDFDQRIAYIKMISTLLTDLVSTHKELDFLSKMITEHIKLLGFQKEIMGQLKEKDCMDLSVDQLIRYCILKSQLKQADRIRSVFKISDKKFWCLKIKALADGDFWEVLRLFANEKKSPVGYAPFVEECISHHKEEEAGFFIQKISDNKERLKYSLQCKAYEIALPDAVKLKDLNALAKICKNSDNDDLKESAEKTLKQLTNTTK